MKELPDAKEMAEIADKRSEKRIIDAKKIITESIIQCKHRSIEINSALKFLSYDEQITIKKWLVSKHYIVTDVNNKTDGVCWTKVSW